MSQMRGVTNYNSEENSQERVGLLSSQGGEAKDLEIAEKNVAILKEKAKTSQTSLLAGALYCCASMGMVTVIISVD